VVELLFSLWRGDMFWVLWIFNFGFSCRFGLCGDLVVYFDLSFFVF